MGNEGLGFFRVSGDDCVEGEDIWMWDNIKGVAGRGEAAAFGVEEDEVIGKEDGSRDDGFNIEGVEGFSG